MKENNTEEKKVKSSGGQNEILRDGDVKSTLIKLSVPAIIGMIINAVYSAVDTFFVGLLGTEQLGAATVAYPVYMLIAAIGLFIGVGGGTLLAQTLGKNDREKASEIVSTTPVYTLIASVAVTVLVLIFVEEILNAFGATDTILPFAVDYTRVLLTGASVIMLNMAFNNLLRGEGSAALSMNALIIGAVLNIIFDPLFIFGAGLGIKGAAYATILAQAITTIFLLSTYLRGKTVVKLAAKKIKITAATLVIIMTIGLPTFLQQLLLSFAMGMFNIASVPYGDTAIAGIGVVNRIYTILVFILFGFQQGFLPIASYNYGAKRFDKLTETLKLALKWITIYCIAGTVIVIVFNSQIAGIFSNDPEVIRIAEIGLRTFVILFPVVGAVTIYSSFFQALGKTKISGFISSARQGIFLIPALLILPIFFGAYGILFAQATADLLTALVTFVFSRKIMIELEEEKNTYKLKNKEY